MKGTTIIKHKISLQEVVSSIHGFFGERGSFSLLFLQNSLGNSQKNKEIK
jgi:hypothetical protein